MTLPADKSGDQGDPRTAPTVGSYDNKTTLPPLGSSVKPDQPETYSQTQQPFDYNVQPSMYSSYQQTNYDPYQRQNVMQPQNVYAAQYTQPSYTSTTAPSGIRFSYSSGVSAVPATSSKAEHQPHVPQEKKTDVLEEGITRLFENTPVHSSVSKLDFQNGSHNKDDKVESLQPDHASQSHVPQSGQYQISQQSQVPIPPQQYVTQPNDYSGYYYGYTAPPNLRPSVSNDSSQAPPSGAGLYYSGLQTTSTLAPQQAVQVQPQRSGGSTAAPQYYSATPQQNLYASQFQQQQALYSTQHQSSPQQRANQH
ncbi:hypothetical protein I9W82_001397 [Candida metapsilosis]|uniref:Uncharacterized protein n=1 Tax=Candida metapsilosis TaxID=273372 RepID=A0A8H8DE51_9ASCO|nr:hypothetical protein I9W82_001397 [Candida metapsilosis]